MTIQYLLLVKFNTLKIVFSVYIDFLGGSNYHEEQHNELKDIYKFNTSSETWNFYASMEYGQSYHAVELVDYDTYKPYCT